MSILVHSDDFKSGNSSDGVWDLGRNLKGSWTVVGQSMDTQTYPWMFSGQNTLCFVVHADRSVSGVEVLMRAEFDYATIGSTSDLTVIANSMTATMQNMFDTAAIDDPYAATTVSNTVNTGAHTMTFNFDAAVDVMWQQDFIFETTVKPSFNLPSNYPNQLIVTSFTISTTRMTVDPKYLFVYINESSSEYITTSASLPTLLFSTKDTEFIGQSVNIRNDTTSLTIKICRMHETAAVPINGEWYLILQRIG